MEERFGSADLNALPSLGRPGAAVPVLSHSNPSRSTRSRRSDQRCLSQMRCSLWPNRNHLEERVNPGNRGQWTGRSAGIAWTFGQSMPIALGE